MNRLREKPISASANFEQQVQVMAELIANDQSKAYEYLDPLIAIFGNTGAWELLLKAEVRAKEIISGNRKIVMPVVENIHTQAKVKVPAPKPVEHTVVEPEMSIAEAETPVIVLNSLENLSHVQTRLNPKNKNTENPVSFVKRARDNIGTFAKAAVLFVGINVGFGVFSKAQNQNNGDQIAVTYKQEKVSALDYGTHSATITEGNENNLIFMGESSTAYKFDVSKMYKKSSTNGKEGIVLTGTEIEDIAKQEKLSLVLRLTDTTAIQVVIDASGKAEIQKNSEIGKHLKVNSQGFITVVGAQRLIVMAEKDENTLYALASIKGNMKTLTAKDVQSGVKPANKVVAKPIIVAPIPQPLADSVKTDSVEEQSLINDQNENGKMDQIKKLLASTDMFRIDPSTGNYEIVGIMNPDKVDLSKVIQILSELDSLKQSSASEAKIKGKLEELFKLLNIQNPDDQAFQMKKQATPVIPDDVDDEELDASDFGDTEPTKIDTVKTDSIPHASGLDNPQDFEKNLSPVKSHCELDSLPEMPVKTMVRITQEAEDWRCANHYPYFKNGNLVTRDAVVGIDPSTSRLDLFMQETGAFVVRNTNIDKEIAFFELDTSGRIKTYIPEGRMEPEDVITLNYIKYKIPKLSHLRIFEISVVDQHPFSFKVYIRNNQGQIFNETGDLTVIGDDLMIETKMGNKYILSVSNGGTLNIKTLDFVSLEQK